MHFGIKVAWFFLSITGFLSCCVVLWAFIRATGMRWGPILYCIGNTLLQGIFCLGMIYRMDPFQMPRSFCIAQTVIMSFGGFIIAGVTLAFSVATNTMVLKPKTWGDNRRLMKWKNIYIAPIAGFPICASIVQLIFILKFDSVHPSDDLHCDSTHPEWVRFLGYAGIPFIVVWPSLYLSVKSILEIRRMNQHIQRARPESAGDFTSLPRMARKNREISLTQWTGFPPPARPASQCESFTPSIVSPASTMQKFNLPFASPVYGESTVTERSTIDPQDNDLDDASSKVSVSFPTFANPGDGNMLADEEIVRAVPLPTLKADDEGEQKDPRDNDSNYHGDWNEDKVELKSISESIKDDSAMDDTEQYGTRPSGLATTAKARRPIPILAPAVWRIILFQIAFITVQILACISTIIDVTTHRSRPTPIGTQHFALLLAGWGPVIVFGHLPAVRRNLRLWRPVV